ncbi:dihydroorotase [Inhella gelatinilytica]|uniref:Dihydroorotase n=1 Tax=Inhella gelatinilytica TaxID=2795030 RepID=A0A931IY84_9BURK|nr:dihydroorotase [Inhella gelatinilytica]MBH9553185.1 dihydroorotase [Inhella gelatinilytica]
MSNLVFQGARILDPASGLDRVGDVAIQEGRIVALGELPAGFEAEACLDAQGTWLLPGLVDLHARLRASGSALEGGVDSELAAAAAGGVTTLVCPPDTDPVLDEPGLVEMLMQRTARAGKARVLPLGALTRGLAGEALAEMGALTQAGCVGLSQSEKPVRNTAVLWRALQYAASFGHRVWLRPVDSFLGGGVAASGPLATRLGLSGLPAMAESIALHTLFELMRATGAAVHVQRLSTHQGVALLRAAKAEGLPVTADVSVHSLHLLDTDIGFFDTTARVEPPLRQQRDRDALRAALADGTLDALVSDHVPVDADGKTLPFAESQPGATALELLLGLALHWGEQQALSPLQALAPITARAGAVLDATTGRLTVGGPADLCWLDPQARWTVRDETLVSRSKHTPFAFDRCGLELKGRVRGTWLAGRRVYAA